MDVTKREFECGVYKIESFNTVNVTSSTAEFRDIEIEFTYCNEAGATVTVEITKSNAKWLIEALNAAIKLRNLK